MENSVADALALAVDLRVLALPEGMDPARLFGIRLRGEHDFALVPFWSGVAREIPRHVRPPDRCVALALETSGWSAPMETDGSVLTRPSLHPLKRRMHSTTLMYGDDGIDLTVLRYGDAKPELLRGGIGVVPELLRACWSRRRNERPRSA